VTDKQLKMLSRLDNCIVVFEDDSVYTVKDNEVRKVDLSSTTKRVFNLGEEEE
jgi:hypothetical protein